MEVACCYDAEIADLFEKYEFGSLRRFIGDVQPSQPKEEKRLDFHETDIKDIVSKAAVTGRCAILSETDSDSIFSPVRKIIVAVEDSDRGIAAAEGTPADFSELMASEDIVKFGYDLKYQKAVAANNGFRLKGRFMDIGLMHYLINPEKSHKIDILSRTYLDINIDELKSGKDENKEELSLFDSFSENEESVNRYPEAAVTLLLGIKVEEELKSLELDGLYDRMEEPLTKVLSDMEMEGVTIDTAQLRRYASSLAVEMNAIQTRIREMAEET